MQSAPYSEVVERDRAVKRVRCRDWQDSITSTRRERRRWRRRRRREQDWERPCRAIEDHSGASRRLSRNGRPAGARGRKGREARQELSGLSAGERLSCCWKEMCRCRKRISGSRIPQRLAPAADPSGLQSRIHPTRSFQPTVAARKALLFASFWRDQANIRGAPYSNMGARYLPYIRRRWVGPQSSE